MAGTARYDKYEGKVGGFRANLAVALTDDLVTPANSQIGKPLGVGINSSGLVVLGAGATGVIGVIVADSPKAIGDPIDVMVNGEIVDLDEAAFDPGAIYYSTTAGVINTTNTGARVGVTVADKSITNGVIRSRLIVRVVPLGTDA